jgi:hypothetical protein
MRQHLPDRRARGAIRQAAAPERSRLIRDRSRRVNITGVAEYHNTASHHGALGTR